MFTSVEYFEVATRYKLESIDSKRHLNTYGVSSV